MRRTTTIDPTALEGARQLLLTCLGLTGGDTLALISDGTTRQVRRVVLQAATDLRIDVHDRVIPVNKQIRFTPQMMGETISEISDALAILTCLSSNSRATAFRSELVHLGTNFNNHFGHMPGATISVLVNAVNIDHLAVNQRCDDLALALAKSLEATLLTYEYSQTGTPIREHTLTVPLKRGRYPITSTGIIPRGTWGNIPGGETFIAPSEGMANGIFVLNGAFKNNVLPSGESLLLSFEHGRVVNVTGTGIHRNRFDMLLAVLRRKGGPQYDQLAELGIGVNPGVLNLTGTSLLDEKCAGTAHIAIGDNKRYGGTNESRTHEDLVTVSPSLFIDGKQVLEMGANVLRHEDWRDSLTQAPSLHVSEDTYLERVGNHTSTSTNGKDLRVRQEVASGRLCTYTVGDSEASPILARLHRLLPDKFSAVCNRAKVELQIPKTTVLRGLEILIAHRLVRMQEKVRSL